MVKSPRPSYPKYFFVTIVTPLVLSTLFGCATSSESLEKESVPFMQGAQTDQIKLLNWDWPPDYKDLTDWIFKHKSQ